MYELYLLFSIICPLVVKSKAILECTAQCREGQKCVEDACKPCDPGTFQSDSYHTYTSCTFWSEKPIHGHWNIKKNGSATEDREWECEVGYRQHEYTPNGFECVAIIEEVITTSETPTTTSTTKPTTKSEMSEQIDGGMIAGIVLVLIIVIIILCIVMYKLCRNHTLSVSNNTPNDEQQIHINGKYNDYDYAADSLSKEERKDNYVYYLKIARERLPSETIKLLHYLKFISHDLIDHTIQYEKAKISDPEICLAQTFMAWEKNWPDLDHKKEVADAEKKMTDCTYDIEDGNMYPFYFYLCKNLDMAQGKDLLYRLSGIKNVKYSLQIKQLENKDWEMSFADTLDEWRKECERTQEHLMKNKLQDILHEIGRNDLAQNL